MERTMWKSYCGHRICVGLLIYCISHFTNNSTIYYNILQDILTKLIFISTFQRLKLVVYLISIFCFWRSESRCFCCARQRAWKLHFCSGPFGDAAAAAICSLFNLIKPGTVSRSKDLREKKAFKTFT